MQQLTRPWSPAPVRPPPKMEGLLIREKRDRDYCGSVTPLSLALPQATSRMIQHRHHHPAEHQQQLIEDPTDGPARLFQRPSPYRFQNRCRCSEIPIHQSVISIFPAWGRIMPSATTLTSRRFLALPLSTCFHLAEPVSLFDISSNFLSFQKEELWWERCQAGGGVETHAQAPQTSPQPTKTLRCKRYELILTSCFVSVFT